MRTPLLRRTLAGGAVALATVATAPLVARAQTTINFAANACTGYGLNVYNGPFEVQGFRVSEVGQSGRDDFITPCSSSNFYAGATGFTDYAIGPQVFLTRISLTPFSISSIDLAGLNANLPPFSLTFQGMLANGGGVLQTCTVTGTGPHPATRSEFTTCTFAPTFTNLVGLYLPAQVLQNGRDNTYQFTNVRLDQGAAAVVPEPGTWALFGVGLLGLGGMALRRGSAPTT